MKDINKQSVKLGNNQFGIQPTIEQVNKVYQQAGCLLLESQYKNARTKMKYKCLTCGSIRSSVFDSFKRGNRCKICAVRKIGESQKLTIEQVRQVVKLYGAELISTSYNKSSDKIKIKCKCGTICQKIYRNIQNKKKCTCIDCSILDRSGSNHYEWKNDRVALYRNKALKQKIYKSIAIINKKFNKNKSKRTQQLLGYSFKQLQTYVVSHKNWAKISSNNLKWHLDHIFPIQAFFDHNIYDISIINNLTNLQPLQQFDNLSKGDKYNQDQFKKWIKIISNGKIVL